jgi:beta-galactosidase
MLNRFGVFRKSVLLWTVVIALIGGTSTNSSAQSVLTAGRTDSADMSIDGDWRFIREDAPTAREPNFDDSAWQQIALPHTWNNLDGQDGGNDYYRGPAWYRRHLQITGGQRYFLRFEGASLKSEVFVNGNSVGTHDNGFGAFCFEITKQVNPGDNVVAVRVDNTHFPDVPPLAGDFTIFGGIYRDAHLLSLHNLCISPIDDASPGVYLKQSKVTDDLAEIQVTTKLLNGAGSEQGATVVCTVTDAAGKTIVSTSEPKTIAANEQAEAIQNLKIDRPHLWNGRKDPYLYTATIELKDGEKVLDRSVQPLGLRYFRFDPAQGFFLNGKSYPLHGVNAHQDRIDKGWAIGPKEHEEDYSIIAEMGCTAVRLAHYQHAEYFYQLCDRGGMAVWAESCLVNKINRTPEFYNNTLQELRELIKQNYNHPSILMWSLYNELDYDSGKDPSSWELVTKLNDLSHQLDDTRPTVGASNQRVGLGANWVTDISAFNRYWGWYTKTTSEWSTQLDVLHQARPDRSIGISEYGAGASIYMHEDPPKQPAPTGWWRTEEYQSQLHEKVWSALSQRPWIWGTFLWTQFDFAVDSRREGDHLGRNDKGLVTYDRKTKKDAFYFYKANWSDQPFVYITSRRFAERPVGPMTIKVYSNLDSVDLILNGKSLGQKQSAADHVFTWDVTLEPGQANVKAIGTSGGKSQSDELTWTVFAAAKNRYVVPNAVTTTEESLKKKPTTKPAH